MITSARRAGDPLTVALDRLAGRGISVEPWLSTVQGHPERAVRPTVYLVEPGSLPPATWDELEDWIRLPVDLVELYARAERLVERAWHLGAVPVEVDGDDILRVEGHLVILSALEARLLRLLLERRGELVGRAEATDALWPEGPPDEPRALDNRVKQLRQRLASVPLRVCTVRGRGYLLDWDAEQAARMSRHP